MKKSSIAFLFAIMLVSCTPNMKITYGMDDVGYEYTSTIPIHVEIKELIDLRKENPQNKIYLENMRRVGINGKIMCINAEKHYRKERVTFQLSKLISDHLNEIKLFKSTSFNNPNSTDYYITGNLVQFTGMQKFTTEDFFVGFYGTIATMAARIVSPANIVFEIKDMKLYKKNGGID